MKNKNRRESFVKFQVGDVAIVVSDEKDDDIMKVMDIAKREFYELIDHVSKNRRNGLNIS